MRAQKAQPAANNEAANQASGVMFSLHFASRPAGCPGQQCVQSRAKRLSPSSSGPQECATRLPRLPLRSTKSFAASPPAPINVSRLILGPRCGRGWQRHGRGDGSRSTPPSRQCKQAASAVDAVLRAYDRAERRKSRKFALRATIRSFPSSFRTVCKGCSGSPP